MLQDPLGFYQSARRRQSEFEARAAIEQDLRRAQGRPSRLASLARTLKWKSLPEHRTERTGTAAPTVHTVA